MANSGLRKEIDLYLEEEDGCWFGGMVGFDWGIFRSLEHAQH